MTEPESSPAPDGGPSEATPSTSPAAQGTASTSPASGGFGIAARRWVARLVWRACGWTLVGERPSQRVGILVGAPHTSNLDYLLMLGITWQFGLRTKFLGKKELFRGPLGWLMRATGGIPVDRANPGSVVRELMRATKEEQDFLLVVAAEGTRSKGDYWKSGFYRIAKATRIPVTLGFVDGPRKHAGFGPSFVPGQGGRSVREDMDFVREFYADKPGLRPANRTEPRLREEGDGPL